jgi:hypothetical protein
MSDKTAPASGGLGLSTILFVVFLVLKLTGQIDWSWWWVTAPLWGGLALVVAVVAIIVAVWGIICAFGLFIITKK